MLLDENGEPRVFAHIAAFGREGMRMTEIEMKGFVIASLARVYQEQGMNVSFPHSSAETGSPDLILESRNGNNYFVLVDCFAFPSTEGNLKRSDLSAYRSNAEMVGALPTIAPVGIFCFDTDGLNPICGGSFALKFDSLEAIA